MSIDRWRDKEVVVHIHNGIFSSVHSLSRIRLFATPWIAARQDSLSITISQSSLRLMSINGILLSHKKDCIWVSSNEVDEPRSYYTEWSKSEKERYISYSIVYIQNLEKWYWRIYLQGSNGETDIENRLMDMGGGEEWVRCMERVTWKLT